MRFQTTLIPLALFTAFTACLHAQQHTEVVSIKGGSQTEHTWPRYKPAGERLDIVTLAQPTVRVPCKVKHLHDEDIICHGIHGKLPVTYKREDILALITPPTHEALWKNIAVATVGAGLIAASVFVPVTGVAVLLQVAGGITCFATITDWFEMQDNHDDDLLLYQRPDTSLTIALNPGK